MEGYHAEGGNRNDVWHSADGVKWQELPDTPWKPRHAASVFVYDDSLLDGGGEQHAAGRLEAWCGRANKSKSASVKGLFRTESSLCLALQWALIPPLFRRKRLTTRSDAPIIENSSKLGRQCVSLSQLGTVFDRELVSTL